MNNLYRKLLSVFSLLLLLSVAKANTVIVKGYVTSNGVAVNNWPVQIMPDSSTTPISCNQYHVKYTNANGYYIDTLYCNSADITKVRTYTQNCNNMMLANSSQVSSTGVAESNFSICSPTTTCHADFGAQVSGAIAYFSSSNSTAASGSTITERIWSYGDGTANQGGNTVNPSHTYTTSGTYTVRLVIVSSNGCRDTATKTVAITVPVTSCHAFFYDTIAGQSRYFYSSSSTVGSGDSIVERNWFFGDFNNPNNTLGGNVVNPSHTYTYSGTFTACLTIRTARGCGDSMCRTAIVNIPNTTCNAAYTYTKSGSTVTFNSNGSQAAANDQIIKRTWYWGNGDTLGGNVVSPVRTFSTVGNYSVCLRIYTASGCTKLYCQTISITDSACRSVFSYSQTTSNPRLISFNSGSSTGSGGSAITTRIWSFGDGDSLSGNVIYPQHTYATNGTYTVCLKIYTAAGCQNTTCKQVTIAGKSCIARFYTQTTPITVGSPVTFVSAGSETAPPDTLIERHWSFGDGMDMAGNVISPSHVYSTPGTYTVRLIVVSSGGCRDTVSQTYFVGPASTGCFAQFFDSVVNNKSYFYSASSLAGTGDSIVNRYWTFGDPNSPNNTLGGNVVNPYHEYPSNGTYTVCLKIVSSSGCVDSTCHNITINTVNTCNALYAYNRTSYTVGFNSSGSSASGNYYITSRKWKFGNGDSLMGNVVSPVYTYTTAGTYNVCLTINTSGGCSKTYCQQITIYPDSACKASFTTNVSQNDPRIIYFTSTSTGGSGSSITTFRWKFGDGDSLLSNTANVSHTYANAGTYTACLSIRTSNGCENTFCKTITVAGTCKAAFTTTLGTSPAGYPVTVNSSASQGDSITTRTLLWGDGSSTNGNMVSTTHNYAQAGNYTICLIIITKSGCGDSICKTITIPPTTAHCHSRFNYNLGQPTTTGTPVYFNSTASEAVTGDSIHERIWIFGDGTSTTGNVVSPVHTYTTGGVYNACLIISTYSGCRDTMCMTVTIPVVTPVHCMASFSFTPTATSVKFQSNTSKVDSGDAIITRTWSFGDGTSLSGNSADPTHQFTAAGTYRVCLTITTSRGCSNTVCKDVVVTSSSVQCSAQFTYSRLSALRLLFNATNSWAPINDSIVQRKWNFGDGSILTGNINNPIKQYINSGIYTVCLKITTAKGCTSDICMPIRVSDSTNVTPDSTENVKIVSLYPNPAGAQMSTVVWSKSNNIMAELSIIDIYGGKRWSMNKNLLNGYNVTVLPTSTLPAGPYTFRVTTQFGTISRKFYKL